MAGSIDTVVLQPLLSRGEKGWSIWSALAATPTPVRWGGGYTGGGGGVAGRDPSLQEERSSHHEGWQKTDKGLEQTGEGKQQIDK